MTKVNKNTLKELKMSTIQLI